MWVGSDTKTAVRRPWSRMSAATPRIDCERRPARVLAQDRVLRHAVPIA